MAKKISIHDLQDKKQAGKKITMLTAYDVITAQIVDSAGIDIILVGDSVGNVFSGFPNTLPVTVENIIYHTQAVARGTQHALIIADMPFMSYQTSDFEAKTNAGHLIKKGCAAAVKVEVTGNNIGYIPDIISMGIPVMGHLGFTPQALHQLGGYKVQGRSDKDSELIANLAIELENAGCFAVLLEMIPNTLTQKITQKLSIPTIGIGAGASADGQVLVTQDLIGLTPGKLPKFVKQYAQVSTTIKNAIMTFKSEVSTEQFPSDSHSF